VPALQMTDAQKLGLICAGIAGFLLLAARRPVITTEPRTAEKVIGSRDASACQYPRECRFPECACELAGVPKLAAPK